MFVAVDLICSKIASIVPNLAYVVDAPKPGVTTKACQRGLRNLTGSGFGGSFEVSDGGHSFLTIGEYRSKALSVVKPHEDLEPLESEHPLRRLIENPNPVDTSFDIAYELQMFEELTGVSYEWLVSNNWKIPCERWCMPSHWVWPRTGGGRYVSPDNPHADELIQYYEIRPWGGMGSAGILRLPPDEVIMTRWKSPINKIDGYSKLAAIAQWIDAEESISKSRWSQFMNQARPELWVELGPGYEDPNDDRISRIEAKFAAKLQGEYNYGKPIITPPGAKLTPLSFSPTEMAYFQSEDQIRDMILSTFRVPPAAVGIVKEMTYGSILATLASLCTYCLNPRLTMRGLSYSKHLASRWNTPGRKVRIWWDDCVPADPSQVNADIETDLHAYGITPNEIRALRGRKSYRYGGDDPMAQGPGGVMPLPMNTGEDLADLAKLIAPMTTAEGKQRSTPEGEAVAVEPGETGAGVEANGQPVEGSTDQRLQQDFVDQAGQAGIENPNEKPSKEVEKDWEDGDWPEEAEPDWVDAAPSLALSLPRTTLLDLPDVRQEDVFSCGAAAAMSVGRYFGAGPETLAEWKEVLGTDVKESTSPQEIVRYLTSLGLQVSVAGGLTLDHLRQAWQSGRPVICPIQEYGVPSKQASFDYGHYVVVVGAALGQVFVQDPAIENVLGVPGGDVPVGTSDPDELQAPGRSMILEAVWERVWHDKDAEGNEYDHFGIIVGPPVTRGKEVNHAGVSGAGSPSLVTARTAGAWLAKEWAALESKYRTAMARALAIAKLSKFPLPVPLAEVVKEAERLRSKSFGPVNRLTKVQANGDR